MYKRQELAELYKIFSDNTRLKIICALGKDELCVCDICELLSLNQSTVSHQLRILKSSKLVKYRRQGKQIFYSLDDDLSLIHILFFNYRPKHLHWRFTGGYILH